MILVVIADTPITNPPRGPSCPPSSRVFFFQPQNILFLISPLGRCGCGSRWGCFHGYALTLQKSWPPRSAPLSSAQLSSARLSSARLSSLQHHELPSSKNPPGLEWQTHNFSLTALMAAWACMCVCVCAVCVCVWCVRVHCMRVNAFSHYHNWSNKGSLVCVWRGFPPSVDLCSLKRLHWHKHWESQCHIKSLGMFTHSKGFNISSAEIQWSVHPLKTQSNHFSGLRWICAA